jgi:hypothetical protein
MMNMQTWTAESKPKLHEKPQAKKIERIHEDQL